MCRQILWCGAAAVSGVNEAKNWCIVWRSSQRKREQKEKSAIPWEYWSLQGPVVVLSMWNNLLRALSGSSSNCMGCAAVKVVNSIHCGPKYFSICKQWYLYNYCNGWLVRNLPSIQTCHVLDYQHHPPQIGKTFLRRGVQKGSQRPANCDAVPVVHQELVAYFGQCKNTENELKLKLC